MLWPDFIPQVHPRGGGGEQGRIDLPREMNGERKLHAFHIFVLIAAKVPRFTLDAAIESLDERGWGLELLDMIALAGYGNRAARPCLSWKVPLFVL